jgi:hypothetical protein
MSTSTDWSINGVIGEAFKIQVGKKKTFFLASLITGALFVVAIQIIEAVAPSSNDLSFLTSLSDSLIQQLLLSPLAPLGIGFGLLGIRAAMGRDVSISTLVEPYLELLLTTLGFILFLLPGIYLSVAYAFAPILMIEKDMGVWESLEASRKAVTAYWWRFFFLNLAIGLLAVLGGLTIIGIFWVVPMILIALGLVYTATFDDRATDSSRGTDSVPD